MDVPFLCFNVCVLMQTRWKGRGGCLEESSRRKGCVFRCVCVCVKGGGIIILWVLVQGVGSS